jgi:hypothetical protein
MNVNKLASASSEGDPSAPFDPIIQIPFDAASQMQFLQTHYWGEDPDARKEDAAGSTEECGFETHTESGQSWRRIDGDWLDIASSLALQLDSATNNTSLVLAIEVGNGKVLLFAADAQVGNCLSWQDLSRTIAGKAVTGPDLLGRTILYKARHHGSHDATLQEKGLEMMTSLEIALIPGIGIPCRSTIWYIRYSARLTMRRCRANRSYDISRLIPEADPACVGRQKVNLAVTVPPSKSML